MSAKLEKLMDGENVMVSSYNEFKSCIIYTSSRRGVDLNRARLIVVVGQDKITVRLLQALYAASDVAVSDTAKYSVEGLGMLRGRGSPSELVYIDADADDCMLCLPAHPIHYHESAYARRPTVAEEWIVPAKFVEEDQSSGKASRAGGELMRCFKGRAELEKARSGTFWWHRSNKKHLWTYPLEVVDRGDVSSSWAVLGRECLEAVPADDDANDDNSCVKGNATSLVQFPASTDCGAAIDQAVAMGCKHLRMYGVRKRVHDTVAVLGMSASYEWLNAVIATAIASNKNDTPFKQLAFIGDTVLTLAPCRTWSHGKRVNSISRPLAWMMLCFRTLTIYKPRPSCVPSTCCMASTTPSASGVCSYRQWPR